MLPVSFWIRRAALVFAGIFVLLCAVEMLKGHGWQAALGFAALWAAIATAAFMATRLWHASRGRACAICQDTPPLRDADPR